MSARIVQTPLFSRPIVVPALRSSITKLDPRHMVRNPVMFVTEVGAMVSSVDVVRTALHRGRVAFVAQIAVWLWFTVVFSNFAESMAEGRGKAQAEVLRRTSATMKGHKLEAEREQEVPATSLRKGDVFIVRAGEIIPTDGDIIEGAAAIDESAISGEAAPVIRGAGGDRSGVTGGTKLLSDVIIARATAEPGESFVDRMIRLVEGAERQKTPNEIALSILLSALTLLFLVVVMTLEPFARYFGIELTISVLIGLLVCLAPTTIGGLLNAIGIAGIDRLVQMNILAMSGRAVESAGDIDVVLLDKTGTITIGSRQAIDFVAAPGVEPGKVVEASVLASLADETPEGRSVIGLAERRGFRRTRADVPNARFSAFSAETRMSGVDLDGTRIRKGAASAVRDLVVGAGQPWPGAIEDAVEAISRSGGTPLVVATNETPLGVIHLKDIVKPALSRRLRHFHDMGIKTIMVTGDNQLTAEAIAKEAGVDEVRAQEVPEAKLEVIEVEQRAGHLVGMTGDGTNDAPALAQADVGLAMNTGTEAAKEAGNMVDLDSDPTKLMDVVEVGKQLLITRGALTTFSISNDVAKYFAILPAMMLGAFPEIAPLNVMRLATPESAVLSAVMFNALIIVLLIPLALRGARFRPLPAAALLRRNLVIYGIGGLIAPFVGIKAIDLLIHHLLYLV